MTRRLQVLLDDEEMASLQATARQHRTTVAALVRSTLRTAVERDAGGDTGARLAAISEAAAHAFPTGEIDEILADIERGYGEDGNHSSVGRP
jgi:hypothetical protein